jgi:hypothetical protein
MPRGLFCPEAMVTGPPPASPPESEPPLELPTEVPLLAPLEVPLPLELPLPDPEPEPLLDDNEVPAPPSGASPPLELEKQAASNQAAAASEAIPIRIRFIKHSRP